MLFDALTEPLNSQHTLSMLEDHLGDQQMEVVVHIASCSKHPLVSFVIVVQIQFSSEESLKIVNSKLFDISYITSMQKILLQMLTAQVEEGVLGSF